MNFLKKLNGKKKIVLVFIGISLFAITGIYAITNFFTAQSRHEVKIRSAFARLIVTKPRKQDESFDKYLIPVEFPNLTPTTDTHKAIHTFNAKLDNNGKPITETMYLKTTLSYDTENNTTFTTTLASELFNSRILIDGTVYEDTKRPIIIANKDHIITIETQQKDFLLETVKDPKLFVVIDYELVDSEGKAFAGTKEKITSQIAQTNTMSNL